MMLGAREAGPKLSTHCAPWPAHRVMESFRYGMIDLESICCLTIRIESEDKLRNPSVPSKHSNPFLTPEEEARAARLKAKAERWERTRAVHLVSG